MHSSTLTLSQISNQTDSIGNKTKNLVRLTKAGFCVPRFIAIPSRTLIELTKNIDDIHRVNTSVLVENIVKALPADFYAVRSSALIEDGSQKSYAGQFVTKLRQSPAELEKALKEVIHHAFEYFQGDLKNFSIIIQEYIEPDYAGVTFTRDPIGGREMVIEYYQGNGEKLVAGEVKPQRLRSFWNQPTLKTILPDFDKSFEAFKNIEKLFGFAQDVEWAIKDNTWYFLQSRPLTTLSREQYEQIIFLDNVLPKNQDFFLEKNEISEIAPRPTPFTLSLLEKIYTDGGPIQRVYQKYGVHFQPRAFLKIIGNELYVDREEELKTILPAYSLLDRHDYKPFIASVRGLSQSIWNIIRVSFISQKKPDVFKSYLEQALEKDLFPILENALDHFMDDYVTIFEINVLAQKSLMLVEKFLEKIINAPSLAELLQIKDVQNDQVHFELPDSYQKEQWQGNSIEISDESPFYNTSAAQSGYVNFAQQQWFASMSTFKKKYCEDILSNARFFHNLREYGRWLTIRHVHHLRRLLIKIDENSMLKNPQDIFFATIQEITTRNFSPSIMYERRCNYEKFNSYRLPPKLLGKSLLLPTTTLGVSAGQIEGTLSDIEHLDTTKDPILFTPLLSPHLTQYFGQIKGIVSEQGGLLSHLAIVARESKIPAIVGVNLRSMGLTVGDRVCIDGSTGTIKKI